MKNIANYAFFLMLTLAALPGLAQDNTEKPKQFSAFPAQLNCPTSVFETAFEAMQGQNINLNFSDNFTFSGTVIHNISKSANLQSVVISSPDFSNTILTISKITYQGNQTYAGTILNKNFFDGYELKKDAAGNYQLNKFETDRVFPDCAKQ